MKAVWSGVVLAESDDTVVVESNHYFPLGSIREEYFEKSETTTHCPWKGDALYYCVVIEAEKNVDAAWYYDSPKHAAQQIKDRIAFWHGVQVIA